MVLGKVVKFQRFLRDIHIIPEKQKDIFQKYMFVVNAVFEYIDEVLSLICLDLRIVL